MIPRQVDTTFCDDIRHEINGKFSYIGVYSSGMQVQTFPFTLPKLGIAIKVITSVAEPFKRLTVRVLKDDEVLQEIPTDEGKLEEFCRTADDISNEQRENGVLIARYNLIYTGLTITAPCILRVIVETEADELRGAVLMVTNSPSNEHPLT